MKKVLFTTTLLALFAAQGAFVLFAELQVPLAQALWWALIGVVRPAALAINASSILLLVVLLLAIDLGIAWAVSTALTTDLSKFGLVPVLFWVLIYVIALAAFVLIAAAGVVPFGLMRWIYDAANILTGVLPMIPFAWGRAVLLIGIALIMAIITAGTQKKVLPIILGFALGFGTSVLFDERYWFLDPLAGWVPLFKFWVFVSLIAGLWTALGERFKFAFFYPGKRSFFVGILLAQIFVVMTPANSLFGPRLDSPALGSVAAANGIVVALIALGIYFFIYYLVRKFIPPPK